MNETMLEELLTAVRTHLPLHAVQERTRDPACLAFSRARALTLDTDLWTPEERGHSETCARCRRLLDSFEREMPHLPLWTLVRRHLGSLSADERRVVAYHLEEGGCRRCRARDERLGAARQWLVQFPQAVSIPHPLTIRAASGTLDVVTRTTDGSLEGELFEENGHVTLEVRTRDRLRNHQLVAYMLRGARTADPREGFLVLQPDVEGWYTAHVLFEAADLHTAMGGRCAEVLVLPMLPDLLSGEEREALLASVERQRDEPASRTSWQAWVEDAVRNSGSVSDNTWQLLCEVRDRLAR